MEAIMHQICTGDLIIKGTLVCLGVIHMCIVKLNPPSMPFDHYTYAWGMSLWHLMHLYMVATPWWESLLLSGYLCCIVRVKVHNKHKVRHTKYCVLVHDWLELHHDKDHCCQKKLSLQSGLCFYRIFSMTALLQKFVSAWICRWSGLVASSITMVAQDNSVKIQNCVLHYQDI